ncbi:hypothetical protein LJC52_00080 [Bacteroidales bacterium OttesenSCG-928-A17]|nr:hypothetical protein [Bacteroidales bacterium OttesenSCG-928-A17]
MKQEDIDHLIRDFYEEDSSRINVPQGLEKRLELFIDELEVKENSNRIRKIRLIIGSVAASLLIIFSGIYLFRYESQKQDILSLQATVEDPYEAYYETQKALNFLSINFNKGLEGLNVVETEVEKTNKIVSKIFK